MRATNICPRVSGVTAEGPLFWRCFLFETHALEKDASVWWVTLLGNAELCWCIINVCCRGRSVLQVLLGCDVL